VVILHGLRAEPDGLLLRVPPNAGFHGLELTPESADRVPSMATAALAPASMLTPAPPPAAGCRTVRLLFIGHSGTANWAMPETIARLIALHQPGWCIETEALINGGKGARWFLESPAVTARIATGGADAVVLQDSSWGPIEQPDDFVAAIPELIARVRAAGMRSLLYAYSGPRRHTTAERLALQARYDAIGRDLKVPVIPCAAALAAAESAEPTYHWQDPDQHHLGLFAGYLNACVWYRALTGESAIAHHERSVMGGRCLVPAARGAALAAIADQVCRGPAILPQLGVA
jgi:hypothetical protein